MNLMEKVNRLIHEIVPTITDEAFFTSKRYAEYLRGIAVGAINTVYTREASSRGRADFKRREKEARIRRLGISVVHKRDDKDLTAYTDGNNVLINAGCELVQEQDSRLFRHLAVLGFLGHEQGHSFFTDFVAFRSWLNYMSHGQWWPGKPQDILSSNGIELTELLEDEGLLHVVVHMAKHLWNSIEDGFIESKMICMFPGLYATSIATLNNIHIEKMAPLDVSVKDPDMAPLLCVLNQLLLYAKYGELKMGAYRGELEDYIYDSMSLLDQARYEGDAKKRIVCTNDILVILSPLLKDFAENYGHLYTQPQQQQATQNPAGQTGGLTPQQTQGMQNLFDRLAAGAGGSSISDATSKPVNSSAVDPQQAQNNMQSAQKGPGGSAGGTYGAPGPAKDLQRIMEDMARSQAEERVEEERLEELNNMASQVTQAGGSGNIVVHRQVRVGDDYRDSYESALKSIESVSRNLQKGIKQVLKDRQLGGKMKYKPSGRRMDPTSLYRKDGLHFCINRLPNEIPPLFVGLLLDESTSMSGEGEQAALATGVCIEHFCRSLGIPHQICGYTTNGGGVSIESYVEPEKADDKDRYRLMGVRAKNYTPTVKAMRYMLKSMESRQESVKLLIVVSDGGAGDNSVHDADSNDTDITRLLRQAQRQNIKVIAAGIGSDRESVCSEFGRDIFLDVSDLEQMPGRLCKIVKRLLPVQ